MLSVKHRIRTFLWKLGYDFSRFTPTAHPIARRKRLFEFFEIDIVLDIGANSGQYAIQLRSDIGYRHRIISFEPLSTAFNLLKINSKNDDAWDIYNFAIGDAEEKREINIASNFDSSSFLNMLPSHIKSAPHSRYIGKELVEIKTLDSLFGKLRVSANNIYMKIDTQGYEAKVLKGAENSLAYIDTIQVEMSLLPLYEGEMLFSETCSLMHEKGYALVAIEDGFCDPVSGQLLQLDGIFHRCRN